MYEKIAPYYGAQIKVSRGLYSHHGIYLDNEHVIHFASLIEGHETDPESARIVMTDLDTFLKGGELEVRVYTEEERKKLRKPQDIVNYAMSQLGRDGYNLVTNNCEHFSNECAFGESKSNQVDNVMNLLASLFR